MKEGFGLMSEEICGALVGPTVGKEGWMKKFDPLFTQESQIFPYTGPYTFLHIVFQKTFALFPVFFFFMLPAFTKVSIAL